MGKVRCPVSAEGIGTLVFLVLETLFEQKIKKQENLESLYCKKIQFCLVVFILNSSVVYHAIL